MRYIDYLLALALLASPVAADELGDALMTLQTAKVDGSNSPQLADALRVASMAKVADVPRILSAVPVDDRLVQNWIRNAADTALANAQSRGEEIPMEMLRDYLVDTEHPPRARRVAYEWLKEIDPLAASQLLPDFYNDPDLELRYDAVATLIDTSNKLDDDAKRTELLKLAFASARDANQLSTCATALDQLGVEVDIVEQLGFITTWRILGPFDNVDGDGFAAVYPPEESIDLRTGYDGKNGEVKWQEIVSDAPMGLVDLAEPFDNEKGAVAYAYATIESPQAYTANLRYMSHNATKLWLNGKLVAESVVYHAGGDGDQYIVPVTLKKGKNEILLKVCQNEQTEPWAQSWEFALRVCDPLGGKIEGVE